MAAEPTFCGSTTGITDLKSNDCGQIPAKILPVLNDLVTKPYGTVVVVPDFDLKIVLVPPVKACDKKIIDGESQIFVQYNTKSGTARAIIRYKSSDVKGTDRSVMVDRIIKDLTVHNVQRLETALAMLNEVPNLTRVSAAHSDLTQRARAAISLK